MTIDNIEEAPVGDQYSVSTGSQVTDDPALKDSNSGRSSTAGDSSQSSDEEASKFVKKESRRVFYLRVLVLLILFAASAAISLVVYFVTTAGETDTFESQYDAAADKVKDAFVHIASEKLEAAGSLVVAMIAHGVDHKRSWPFIALSSFQQRSSTVRGLSGALYLGFMPKVTHEDRQAWENYTIHDGDASWYENGREYQRYISIDDLDNRPQLKTDDPNLELGTGIANYIYDFENIELGKGVISPQSDIYLPTWQTSPVTQRSVVNENFASSEAALDCLKYHEVTFDRMQYSRPGYGSDDDPDTAEIAWLLRMASGERDIKYEGDIYTSVYFPVYNSFDSVNRESVGVMRAVLHWAKYFENVLPESTGGLVVVLENGCDDPFTYQINGKEVVPLGHGDLHDEEYDKYMRSASFASIQTINDGTKAGMKVHYDECTFMIRTYPSDHMVELYTTSTPVVITTSVALVFLFAVLMFFVYDRMVERRQRILMEKAKKTHQIVVSLFPKNVRDQILNDDGDLRHNGVLGAKNTLKSFVSGGMENNPIFGQMPIADLYPESTVMFADIAGFTSWSSSREPAQVFVLLQTLYSSFDEIAKKRRVFKVETIGDSYVACAGVPEADPAHAVKMARFAWDCMAKMNEITKDLETQLGPDTGELSMRFGLNSGPVTAGLLRGDRSRFQLFGDTVNTAARMESTGRPGRIQCSQSTAEVLLRSGKEHWLSEREDLVSAKGKGIMRTFWLTPNVDRANSANSQDNEEEGDILKVDFAGKLASQLLKREREVEWVSELFRDSIREIVAQRATRKGKIMKSSNALPSHRSKNRVPLDEVVDVIKMPSFDSKSSSDVQAYEVKIPENISRLIREYVSIIAAAYKKNPFHNFEHACHVTMCVSKLLKRIVNPDMSDAELVKMKDTKKLQQHLHMYTHGINSDPITLFAILFSAIIHDVDHPGVSNKQLATERPLLGTKYQNKSVAEQNSLDVAWDVLMDSHFRDMREYIFETNEDLSRFRQIVVNTVLATDIFDPELNELRKQRWNRAFSESSTTGVSGSEVNDARATVVIEHIMQASDVCHTMQHWHIYTRHNKNLFEEILLAHREGRCGANPAEFWYEGEMKFFDNYIIPLAQKLKECNIFGVSSDECLNYAIRNRAEWQERGRQIVAEYVQAFAHDETLYGRHRPRGRAGNAAAPFEEEKTQELG